MSSSIKTNLEHLSEAVASSSTLVDLLRLRAERQPELTAYTFLLDGETEEDCFTYGQLDEQARAIGAWLQSFGAEGERVLLLYPPGLNYIAAFFGCLYAGAIAVPAYPPRLNHSLHRLQAIIKDAEAKYVLTTTAILSKVESLFEQAPFLKRMRWLDTERIADVRGLSADWREPSATGDTIAFLQYTSGSTSAPKGVMVSHGNLLHNERMIQRACEHTEASTFAGWLPLYHDMGLIGNVLQPLYIGARCVLMSPVAFLQKPFRWLQAVSRYKAHTSGGPNFAYDLCVRKTSPAERETLDLSSWRTAFNGAEPIRHETMERFAAAFAPCGFRAEAFYPCYGLAEATLIVSGGLKTAPPVACTVEQQALEQNRVVEASPEDEGTRVLVGSGQALLEQKIVIADPEALTLCPPGEVGEIWLAGSSVAKGYWKRPEQTEQTFHAYVMDSGEGPFLRTGDLGFMKDGELFVTGRLKDLIIIRGRNHYPQDIELSVERSHTALRPGCGAAFSVEADNEERLVVVQELDARQETEPGEVFEAIRQAVAVEHELEAYAIVLLRQGRILKTSSGKIQRHACRAAFLDGSLEPLGEWRAGVSQADGAGQTPLEALFGGADETEAWLVSELAAKLRADVRRIDAARPLAQYGLDSLAATELAHGIEARLGVRLPMSCFLQDYTITQLAAQVRELQATQRTAPQSLVAPSPPSAPSSAATSEHPLSSGQQALWFIQQVAPESAAYNISSAVRIRHELDVPALRRAFQALVNRHLSLRTTFPVAGAEPVQRVHPRGEICFEEQQASGWSEAALDERLVEEAHRPFDLENGPLLRVNLLTRSPGEHVLLLAAHHIVADLWSLAVMMKELGTLYEAELTNSLASLAPLAAGYADYVQWQREMLASREGERLGTYWKERLAGATPVLNLLTDRPRPAVQTFRGASKFFTLDEKLTSRIKSLSREHDATLYMTLLAAFQALLYRYAGQEDFLVGSPVANRDRAEFAGVVGYFVNPLVMRAACDGEQTFESFLAQVRRTVLGALEHHAYPFPQLVEQLQPERDPSRSTLFQVMFTLQKAHLLDDEGLTLFALGGEGARMRVGSLEFESIKLPQRVAQFDLTLMMAEADGRLHGSLEYNTDLYDETTIERGAKHLEVLLEGIVAGPARRLSELPLLVKEERQKVLVEWNETARDYRTRECLHELFEEQVERTPDAVAVVFEDECLSYRELNRRANQLAHRLRAEGVGPEVRVGVLAERSTEMVVALVAILKAGGAYVPLDPQYPEERLAYMMEDARLEILLTQARLAERPCHGVRRVICLDGDREAFAGESGENLPVVTEGDNLAYVIYTSGSTGRPKGAMNTHRGIVNRLCWMQEAYQLGAADRVVQKTPFSFDVSVWEFFWPLMTGARLIVARPGGHQDGGYLARLIREQEITTIHFVPSMLQVFLDEPNLSACRSLKRVICSGEALTSELEERFFAARLDAGLHNLYGPTEAAVDVTFWACEPGRERPRVPIGRPIANTQIYILDERMQPVPAGVTGELHIGGVGLARGYLNRPDLTAEKFIPHPFSTRRGARLYRTGDLARYMHDGEIDFLGRLDHQVKIRGFRIELNEVEAVLRQHGGVREALVVASEDDALHKRLFAYIVAETSADTAATAGELRGFLQGLLPDYMIPSAFVWLDELPLTPSGKVNRRALPAPTSSRPESETPHVAPRNRLEREITSIWQEVLQVEKVGVNDKFFDLGGQSLLMAQVQIKLRERLRRDVPLIELLKHPTVGALAGYLGREESEPSSKSRQGELVEKLSGGKSRLKQLQRQRQKGVSKVGSLK